MKARSIEIDICDYSKKGNGIGYFTLPEAKINWTVEVPFTMPGDRVRAKVLRKRGGLHAALLEEILSPSLQRTIPRCVHFGTCGGCRWQHLPYSLQLERKEAMVRHYFAPFLTEKVAFHPILPCAEPWGYRNKMEFSFNSNAAKEPFLGLMLEGGKGKVLNLTECHLVAPWFMEALKAVRHWWAKSSLDSYHCHRNSGSLRTLIVREGKRSGDRLVMLTVSGHPDYALNKQQIDHFVSTIRAAAEPSDPQSELSIFLRIQQIAKGRATEFFEMHLYGPDTIRETLYITSKSVEKPHQLTFKISPSAFFQPNTVQAEQLYSRVLQLAEIPPHGVIYDLYCGTGTLGLCLAHHAKEVIGIELSRESALDARTNAKLNGANNVRILEGSVGDILQQMEKAGQLPQPDLILVDPPRPGLEPLAIRQLLALKAPKIAYISCNPATQSDNIALLLQGGYQLQAVQPVDQFPQTVHIENIAILTRAQEV